MQDANTRESEEEAQRRLLARPANGETPASPPYAAGAPPPPPTGFASFRPHYAAPPPPEGGWLQRLKAKGGIPGAIASALLVAAKVGGPGLALLVKLKFLLGAGSMLVSMWAWGLLYGWKFGVGLVLLIFLHECGHVVAFRLRGIPVTGMVFLPFFGAYVTGRRGGKDAAENAFIGIMGPVFGFLAGVACLAAYLLAPSPFWIALAQWSFLINLFNLLPIPSLDGSRLFPLFARDSSGAYGQASLADRWKYGTAFGGLAVLLGVSWYGAQALLNQQIRPVF